MTGAPARSDERRCIKCGREVGADESICEFCNRAGMATPSASQYHGTVAVAIVRPAAIFNSRTNTVNRPQLVVATA